MQGLTSMTTNSRDHSKEILEDRKRRRTELQVEMRALSKHKKRLKFRLQEGRGWPIDSRTGQNAEIDHDDVMAPLPEEMRALVGDIDEKMHALRIEADKHESFADPVVPIDRGVMLRRQEERAAERAHVEAVRGEVWTEDLVEARLDEAYRTLFRSSVAGVRPRAFGNAMPEIVREVSDLVHQAGNKSLRNAISHRFKEVPTQDEVRRAEDALGWALTYLRDHDPDLAGFLNLGAMWRAWGAKITAKCASHGIQRQTFYRDRKDAVKLIVEGLIRDGKAPT